MPKGDRRAGTANIEALDRLIGAGAYNSAQTTGAYMPANTPTYGDATMGQLRSNYTSQLPENVAGPLLPDIGQSVRNAARAEGGDQISQDIRRDKMLYDRNLAVGSRQYEAQGGMGVDVYNDPQVRADVMAANQSPNYAAGVAIPKEQLAEIMRAKMQAQAGPKPGI